MCDVFATCVRVEVRAHESARLFTKEALNQKRKMPTFIMLLHNHFALVRKISPEVV